MPPYSRLMAASAAAAWNEANARGGRPNSASVLSTNANPAPNSSVSTVAAAVEMTLWPLVYSGKGGVCSRGCQRSSRWALITVSGRIRLLRYFSSQQLMKPSAIAVAVRA